MELLEKDEKRARRKPEVCTADGVTGTVPRGRALPISALVAWLGSDAERSSAVFSLMSVGDSGEWPESRKEA